MPPIDLEELQRSMDRLKQANDRLRRENELLPQLEELREVNEQKFLLGLSGDGFEKPGCEVGSSRDESEATLGRLDEVMDETQAPSGEKEQEKETVKEDKMDEDKQQRDTGEDSSDEEEEEEEEEAQFTEYGSNSDSDDNKAMTDEWNSDDPEHQLDDNMESDSEYDAEEEQRALHEKLKEHPPRLRRNQFLSRHKLAKFGATTVADEEFLNAGVSFTTKVGDCKLDASLYVPTQLDPIVRRDYAVYKSVYGLHPGIVSLIDYEPTILLLDKHAESGNFAGLSWNAEKEVEAFDDFIEAFEAADFPSGYLDEDVIRNNPDHHLFRVAVAHMNCLELLMA